jgi:ribosomal protein S18 acetylase RimI-like enzyme
MLAHKASLQGREVGIATPDTIHIERAQPADAAAVTACVHDAYANYVPRIGQEPAPMNADYGSLIARGVVYVLREPGGDVCGVLVMMPEQDALFIENVAVHPDHQGRGFGRCLLTFAEEHARAGGLRELRLYTHELMTENIAYYRRLGYDEIDRRLDHGFRRVFMKKVLEQESEPGRASQC